MTARDVSSLCVSPESSLRDVIAVIDANEEKIVLVVDSDRRLITTITDGDSAAPCSPACGSTIP